MAIRAQELRWAVGGLVAGLFVGFLLFGSGTTSSKPQHGKRVTLPDKAEPLGQELLYMLESPLLPPYTPQTGRFDFSKTGCDPVLWIDVGAHKGAERRKEGRGITLAFEPQLGFWSVLRNQHPCTFPFPAVAGAKNGMLDFHTSQNGHSSSLLKVDQEGVKSFDGLAAGKENWASAVQERATFPVFSIRLDDVIPRIPPGIATPYLKVDAQGYDLEVVKTAGEFVRIFDRVKVEAKAEGTKGAYAGQPSPSEIKAYMAKYDFEFVKEEEACCLDVKLEVDLYFRNTRPGYTIGPSCPGISCAVVPPQK